MTATIDTDDARTDPRTNPLAYLSADRVRLPDDVRKDPMTIAGIGTDYVALRGNRNGWYRLDLSDPDSVGLRYYSETKDYWQPTDYFPPGQVTLLDTEGEAIDPQSVPTDDAVRPPPGEDPAPEANPPTQTNAPSLASSALSDMGIDATEADIPAEWDVVSPESDDAQSEGLGGLFDSKDEARDDYAAQLSGLGLVQLLRDQPVTIDWDGASLTLYPPRADGSDAGGDV